MRTATTITQASKPPKEVRGAVHCPLCTHTVEARVLFGPRGPKVIAGQKCPRCSSSLDAGFVLRYDRAA